jgi:UDP-N-acetylmuramoylalanine--D-glutamate ligase
MMAKKLVILGAGESGVGAAILGKAQGFEVFVSDKGTIKPHYLAELDAESIAYETGTHTLESILTADLIIKSPGLSDQTPVMQAVIEKNIPVWSEIEFAAQYTNAKLIGISGTNGKTTTTLLTYHLLKNAGLHVGLAGNIGKSFARQVAKENYDCYVLELSSFQLDNMYNTKLHIAILTNITPDHLDRYQYDLNLYIAAKMRLLQNQKSSDFFIYCSDDPLTLEALQKLQPSAQLLPFSLNQEVDNGAFNQNNQLVVRLNHNEFKMSFEELPIKGKHNQYNSMAAGLSAKIMEIRNEAMRENFKSFENAEHRLEFVASVRGVDYINDSKATNVNSAWYALESATKPVIWIAGGVDKGNDYNILLNLVKEKAKAIICLGKDNRAIHDFFHGEMEVMVNCLSMKEAVDMAYKLSSKGDMVLLSPACASFDLFENYEDRGNQFKKAVKEL